MEIPFIATSTAYIKRVKDRTNTFESLSEFLQEPMTFSPKVVKSIVYDVFQDVNLGDFPLCYRIHSDLVNEHHHKIMSLFIKSLVDSMYRYVFNTNSINKDTIDSFIAKYTLGKKDYTLLRVLRDLFKEIEILESYSDTEPALIRGQIMDVADEFERLLGYISGTKVKNTIDYIDQLIEESKIGGI